jgi:protein disulfide-isomerase
VTYQWEKDGVPIAGAKSKTFSIASVKISDKGVYAVIVCDASGCTPSLGATLGVKSTTASGWTENFTDAKTRASTLKRHLLLNFTGSDWCGWCIKLDSEVFSKPEFKSLADSNLVLAKIDFPRTRSQDLAIKSQNQGLLSTYNVTGFPTLILLDSSGKEVKRWRGFSSQFLAELKKQIGAGNASSGAGDAAFAARVAAYPVPSDSKLRDSYDLLMSVWKMKPHWTNPPLPPSETGLSASIQYIYAVSSWIATNARNDGDTQIADYYADFALQAQKQYEALTPR